VSPEIEQLVIELRQKHSKWGPKKLHVELAKVVADSSLPSRTTLANILSRNGLSMPRRKRRHCSPYEEPLAHATDCNVVWCIDFKGWFRTSDGCRIDPLTITDAHSRFLLCLQAVRGETNVEHVMALMKKVFQEFGLPERIRSDNGGPFASTGLVRIPAESDHLFRLNPITCSD
jgi:transposase InsO family protein